mgnify:FL=1
MGFSDQKYILTVKDSRTLEPITTGCYVFVYDAGTKTLSTLYKNSARATLANPITRAQFAIDQKVSFYSTQTSVDVFVADEKGNVSFVPSVTPNDKNIILNRDGVVKCLVAPWVFNAGGTETDTGLDFPINTLVTDVLVEVVTVDATETLNVGLLSSETAGDVDGLAALVSIANAGFIRPWVVTDGTNEDFIATPYKGALIGLGSAGTDVANDFGSTGGYGHIVTGTNARSLVYQPSSSDTGAGYLYAFFRHLR